MQIELTKKVVNQMAARIVVQNPELTKPRALEMLAHAFSFRNFDTMTGVLTKPVVSKLKQTLAEVDTVRTLVQPIRLQLACFTDDEYESPPAGVTFLLTTESLSTILEYQADCLHKGRESVCGCIDMAAYENKEFTCSLDDWVLAVKAKSFCFTSSKTKMDFKVTTFSVDIKELLNLLESRERGTKTFQWVGGQLLHVDDYDRSAMDELFAYAVSNPLDYEYEYPELLQWVQGVYDVPFENGSEALQNLQMEAYHASLGVA